MWPCSCKSKTVCSYFCAKFYFLFMGSQKRLKSFRGSVCKSISANKQKLRGWVVGVDTWMYEWVDESGNVWLMRKVSLILHQIHFLVARRLGKGVKFEPKTFTFFSCFLVMKCCIVLSIGGIGGNSPTQLSKWYLGNHLWRWSVEEINPPKVEHFLQAILFFWSGMEGCLCVTPRSLETSSKEKTFQGGWYPLETIVPMNHIPLLHWLLWLYDKHTHSGPIFPSTFLPLNVFTPQLPQARPNIGLPNWSIVKLMACKTKVISMVAKWQVCQRHFCSSWI